MSDKLSAILALAPFVLVSLFSVACMVHKFSDKYLMGVYYTAAKWSKVVSIIGHLGFYFYLALCADWIVIPGTQLEFSGFLAFGILAASLAIPYITGTYNED